ncbi:D-isomer specific 2-hydroxyacid dehydrogenase family protein [Perilla frutescens var. hirtella]|uniref:D-isomer specific 2-hydroxyacid dehydrogenase family protein n=1 Tax=Perilla frutescens var. hirtella TaxID=608512 RepID=A0AAD4PAQ2_PERFH|nr:D-isomer specific 2-hydroxyacid dehydrogenase family protein [Perilla frutescens var. hirtella]
MASNQPPDAAQQLPEIIVLGPPSVFRAYDGEFSSRFQVLRPWESQSPLPQFLADRAQSTRAALCSGAFSLSAAILCNLPSLGLIVTTSAGLDHIDLTECRRRGIAVASAGNIFSADVADLAVGLLLDLLRKISTGNRFVRDGLWPRQAEYPLGVKVGGKRVGIVGLGSIGVEVAKRLEAFGCAISYYSRKKKPLVSYAFYPDIYALALNSDVLVLCCALTEQTHHMINREVMVALGKDGVIVNIARGAVIDEKELVCCLQQGEIAAAGLDVFENEPRVPNELYELDSVVLSPHAAVFTEESFTELYQLMAGNLEAFFSNRPLLSPIPDE